jgi:hypothetical protein
VDVLQICPLAACRTEVSILACADDGVLHLGDGRIQ